MKMQSSHEKEQKNAGPTGIAGAARNASDQLVLTKIKSTPIGELPTDFLLSDEVQIRRWREHLYQIYLEASTIRHRNKATRKQIAAVELAIKHLTEAISALNEASFGKRDGLIMQLQGTIDKKGADELHELSDVAWTVKHKVTPEILILEKAVSAEKAKPERPGEARKRLRTLVDALGERWLKEGGILAITVDITRRDPGQKSVVRGRRGPFLDFAVAAFCEIDDFQPSEVEAAVVHTSKWPAPGSEDTEFGVLMGPEGGHGETEVYARVQA